MRVIPTLTSRGHAKTVEERVDAILTYYQALNPSMSNRFSKSIKSLQAAIWTAGTGFDSMERTVSIVKTDLEFILSNNFPEGATVDVSAQEISGSDATFNLLIAATVVENEKTYDLSTSLERIDSRFMNEYQVKRVNAV